MGRKWHRLLNKAIELKYQWLGKVECVHVCAMCVKCAGGKGVIK